MTPSTKTQTRHAVKIDFHEGKFAYSDPTCGRPAHTINVKKGDIIHWHCEHGNFSILFKEHSPFETVGVHAKRGQPTMDSIVTGPPGNYSYAVTVLPLDGVPAVDDPEVIVDGGS